MKRKMNIVDVSSTLTISTMSVTGEPCYVFDGDAGFRQDVSEDVETIAHSLALNGENQ